MSRNRRKVPAVVAVPTVTSRALGRLDRRLLAAAAARRTPTRDRVLTTASRVADRSRLWLASAALLAVSGERRQRAAAASGLAGIAVATTLVNGPLKVLWRRGRPPQAPVPPLLPLPRTYSFPSGHAASAFAFATGVSRVLPAAATGVVPMAAAVAYSRVHTGVHYPSDVAVGAGIGVASGLAGAAALRRLRLRSAHRIDAPTLGPAVPRRAIVVGSSGSGGADALADVCAMLTDRGFDIVRRLDVAELGRVRDLADGAPLVIAAGGDGTVGAVANAIHGTRAVVAALPLGTSNDIARSLGWTPDPVAAAAALADGRVTSIDAGHVVTADGRSQVFLNAVTIGLNVAFARHATDRRLRDRFGGLTYPVAAARAVRGYQPFPCTITTDSGWFTTDVVHVSVSVAPVFGGVLGMRVPGASMSDGLLDVTVVEPLSLARLWLAAGDAVIGRHRPVRHVTTLQVPTLHVSTAGVQQIAIDGEVGGTEPVEFRSLPGAIRMVVP